MVATQESYFKDNNLMDIHLLSTYGFDDGDMEAIRNVEGIKGIYPTYSKDVFVKNDRNANPFPNSIPLTAPILSIAFASSASSLSKTGSPSP